VRLHTAYDRATTTHLEPDMQIPANDNDAAIGSVRRAARESSAFTEMIEPPPTMIDFDDPKVLLRLLELGNVVDCLSTVQH
jgi:hypothetical protein